MRAAEMTAESEAPRQQGQCVHVQMCHFQLEMPLMVLLSCARYNDVITQHAQYRLCLGEHPREGSKTLNGIWKDGAVHINEG